MRFYANENLYHFTGQLHQPYLEAFMNFCPCCLDIIEVLFAIFSKMELGNAPMSFIKIFLKSRISSQLRRTLLNSPHK